MEDTDNEIKNLIETQETETADTVEAAEKKPRLTEIKFPVKPRHESLPGGNKENPSTIESAIMRLTEELQNLADLRDAVEENFSTKAKTDDEFQSKIVDFVNMLETQFEKISRRITNEIDYTRELEERIKNSELERDVHILERELNEERAKISRTLDEISTHVRENLQTVKDKCLELNSAGNLVEQAITKFREDVFNVSEREFKVLSDRTEKELAKFGENSKKTLETVKKLCIDFLSQCEKENKALIEKIPVVKGKMTAENWIVIVFGCLGIAGFFLNFL